MVLGVGGSSPLGHPKRRGPVARLRRASSSIWQSNGLLIRRFGVRIPGGPRTRSRCRDRGTDAYAIGALDVVVTFQMLIDLVIVGMGINASVSAARLGRKPQTRGQRRGR